MPTQRVAIPGALGHPLAGSGFRLRRQLLDDLDERRMQGIRRTARVSTRAQGSTGGRRGRLTGVRG
jgi:acetyl-CoA acetyltransferase